MYCVGILYSHRIGVNRKRENAGAVMKGGNVQSSLSTLFWHSTAGTGTSASME